MDLMTSRPHPQHACRCLLQSASASGMQAPATSISPEATCLQAGIGLSIPDGQDAVAPDELLQAMRLTLDYSTSTGHPLFFNQLYGGPEPAGIAGEKSWM